MLEEIEILKQLTWFYVIDNPSLATLQLGHRRVTKELFEALMPWAVRGWTDPQDLARLPRQLRNLLAFAADDAVARADASSADSLCARATADYIATLTEQQALGLHERITGATVWICGHPVAPTLSGPPTLRQNGTQSTVRALRDCDAHLIHDLGRIMSAKTRGEVPDDGVVLGQGPGGIHWRHRLGCGSRLWSARRHHYRERPHSAEKSRHRPDPNPRTMGRLCRLSRYARP